jgi:glutamyl-tRNA reductase
MELVVAGLSHHTAPVGLRERVALRPQELPGALDRLVNGAGFPEGLILSTCNRTEIYTRPRDGANGQAAIEAFAAVRPDVAWEMREHVYARYGEDAVAHLFRVAAGLDSLIVGEPEIVRQMNEAYALACSAGTAGPVLHRTVPRALQVGKRVRSETAISRGITSVAGAAVGLADRVFRDLSTCSILTIGAGETVETALRALRPRAPGKLVVANRTAERAQRLAAVLGGTAAPLTEVARLASESDIVVAATDAPEPLLRLAQIKPLLRSRTRPLLVLDLGVPRDVEPAIGDLPGVYVHCVDDLQSIADRGRAERAQEIPKAEAIVQLALSDFKRRRRALDAEPAIKALLEGMLDVRQASIVGEKGLSEAERAAVERVTGKLVDKLLRRLAPRIKDGTTNPREILDAFGVDVPDDPGPAGK